MAEPTTATATAPVTAPLVLLTLPEAAALLADTPPENSRGFLGTDPVTQNQALLAAELTAARAQVYRCGQDLYGYLPNPDQPRLAQVASTGADPGALRGFLDFLATYRRCDSYLAMLPEGAAPAPAFTGCGFHQVGVLREHVYQSGRYRDVLVHYANREEPWPS